MPWSSGVFSRSYPSWSNDAANNLPISASKFDQEDSDFATGISFCLSKDGLSGPQQAMTWGLTTAQVLQLNRGSDGAVFGIGRTGGSTNPSFKFSIADTGGLTLGGSSGGFTLTNSGNLTLNAPSSGTTLVVSGAASAYSMGINASTTTANSYGLAIHAGTTSGDAALTVGNASVTSTFFNITGAGQTSITSPTSGATACTINGASSAYQLYVQSGNSASTAYPDVIIARAGSTANSVEQGPSISLYDSAGSTQTCLQQSGGQTELWQYNGGWAQIFKVTSSRQFSLQQSTANVAALNVSSGVSAPAAAFATSVSGYAPIYLQAAATGSPVIQISSGITTGSATPTLGSNKPGSNTSVGTWIPVSINAVTYYIPAWT